MNGLGINRWSLTVEGGVRKLWFARIYGINPENSEHVRVVKIGYDPERLTIRKEIWSFDGNGKHTGTVGYDNNSIEEAAQGEIDPAGWRVLWDGADE